MRPSAKILTSFLALLLTASTLLGQGVIFRALNGQPGGGGTGNAFTFVRSSVGATDGGGLSGTAITGTMPSAVTAGHFLVAQGVWSVTSGTASGVFSDNNSDTWVKCGTPSPSGGQQGITSLGNSFAIIYYVLSANSGSPTISLTTSSATTNFRGFMVSEYSYTGTAAIDAACSYTTPVAASSLLTTSSITTAVTNELVYSACMAINNACTLGTGYTSVDNGYAAGTGALSESKTQATASAGITATYGATNGNDSIIAITAFKAQ